MNKKDKNVCFIGVILVICLWIVVECNRNWYTMSENFTVLQEPGIYPDTVANPILYGDYPISSSYPNPIVSNSLHDLSIQKSEEPISSYEQVTNNYRYWKNPENGSVQDPSLSGYSFYGEKMLDPELPACSPGWSDSEVRINYYNSGLEGGSPGRLDL
jgi:hypothetical protein